MTTTGIVLAAGMGKRLMPHTANKPKALVEVAGKPLVAYAIKHVQAVSVSNIIVVGGYFFDDLKESVHAIDPKITVVENKDYELQNLVSFSKALTLVPEKNGIFVANTDYIFADHSLRAMKEQMKDFSVFCSYDLSGNADDVMKVKVDEEKNMIAMSKQLTDFDAIYNGYWYVSPLHMPLVRSMTETFLKSENLVTTAVERLFVGAVEKGSPVTVTDIGPADWFEVDTPEELSLAKASLEM